MASNQSSEKPLDKEELIEIKKLNFWRWFSSLRTSENENESRLEKVVPGLASILAIILFLLKDFIIKQDQKTLFTDSNINFLIYAINAVILFFIITIGLKERKEKEPAPDTGSDNYYLPLNLKLYQKQEQLFIKYIKKFFGVTLLLYLSLIISASFFETNKTVDTSKVYSSLMSGKKDIQTGLSCMVSLVCPEDTTQKFTFRDFHKSCKGNSLSNLYGYFERIKHPEVIMVENEQCIKRDSFMIVSCHNELRTINKILKKSLVIDHPDDDLTSYKFLRKLKTHNDSISDLAISLNNHITNENNFQIEKDSGYTIFLSGLNFIYQGSHKISNVLSSGIKSNSSLQAFIQFIELLISNLGALLVIFCFLILYSTTVEISLNNEYKSILGLKYLSRYDLIKSKEDTKKSKHYTIKILRTSVYTLFTLTVLHIGAIFYSINDPIKQEEIFQVSRLISGLGNALAMCLLFARFESSHFQTTLLVLIFLYSYAVIQAFFGLFDIPFLGNKYIIKDFTTILAFIGKCYLYLYVLWIIKTDRLIYYFYHKEDEFYEDEFSKADANLKKMDWSTFLNKVTQ